MAAAPAFDLHALRVGPGAYEEHMLWDDLDTLFRSNNPALVDLGIRWANSSPVRYYTVLTADQGLLDDTFEEDEVDDELQEEGDIVLDLADTADLSIDLAEQIAFNQLSGGGLVAANATLVDLVAAAFAGIPAVPAGGVL